MLLTSANALYMLLEEKYNFWTFIPTIIIDVMIIHYVWNNGGLIYMLS